MSRPTPAPPSSAYYRKRFNSWSVVRLAPLGGAATAGGPNACSFLYSRCVKIARLMGYSTVITYTLESEGGASLRAVGARPTGPLESHEWSNPGCPRKSQQVYHEAKYRWEL